VGQAKHTVAAALLALLLVACTHRAAPEQPVAAGTPADAPSPVLVTDCWVPTAGGNVAFSGDEARALTTRAADLGRHIADGARVAGRLAAAVLAAAPEAGRDRAAEVAAGLAGVPRADRLVCGYARSAVEPQRPAPNGLVPRANLLRAAWTVVFGPLPAGGFAPGGVSTGHVDGSAHYEGRAVDVFFRPLGDDEQRRRGWVFAQWLLAHAPEHQVLSVIYDDHIWTSWAAGSGWRDYVHPGQSFAHRGNAVLRHLDHVHVAVESGQPFTG
jgi:hypothetical protein